MKLLDVEAITVDKIRAFVVGQKRAARSVFLEYIDEHGCAYCRELRSVFCSMTVQQIRDILQELQSEGVLGSVLVDPPFDGEPNARMQRRYYFRRET